MLGKFQYTPGLVNILADAQGLYRQLESESEIPSLAMRLIKENQMLATHYSTSIEGNPLNQEEVTNILLGDKIPTTKSEKEVKNYFAVLNRISVLAREKSPLTIELTIRLHRELMEGLKIKKPGEFRDKPVVVGHNSMSGIVIKHNPPSHDARQIQLLIADLYQELKSDQSHPLIKAGLLHHTFAHIHPFFDGNGRMARVLTAYYLLLNGYEVTKYFILDDYYDLDRLEYSDKLHSADAHDKTIWLQYFLEGIVFSLQAAIKRVEILKEEEIDAVTGEKRVLVSRREEEVLQIVIDKKAIKTQDLVIDFGVSRQQAQALLSSLVKKGLLAKHGKTKSSYYELAKKPTTP